MLALPPFLKGECVMCTKDTEYFRERAITERAMALAATHPQATNAHEELAERYDGLVAQCQTSRVVRVDTAKVVLEAA